MDKDKVKSQIENVINIAGKIEDIIKFRIDVLRAALDERRANAALIAAAPDLLAALLDAKAALEYAGMDEYTMEAYDRICAAIYKATGEA